MIEIYGQIENDLLSKDELVNVNYRCGYNSPMGLLDSGTRSFKYRSSLNPVLLKRRENEEDFYNFLKSQLLLRLQEIKFYSNVNVMDTRRLVSVSPDCISMIQIIIREQINLIVHFRSSDFNGALPADLEFISRIPYELIQHLNKFKGEPGYDEVNDEIINILYDMPVNVSISFGSVHKI